MSSADRIKADKPFLKEYQAIVADNNDPLKVGRLKVKIPALLGDEFTVWVEHKTASGGVNVLLLPDIDDDIIVKFRNDDVYSGIWEFGDVKDGALTEFAVDYPNVYGIVDKDGGSILVNRKTKVTTFKQGSAEVVLDGASGSITVSGATCNINNSTCNIAGTCTFEGISWLEHTHTKGYNNAPTGPVIQ